MVNITIYGLLFLSLLLIITPPSILADYYDGIVGDVTIGAGSVISPSANIIAEKGSITLGGGNVVGANANIINKQTETLRIGDGNVISAGSTIEALQVGNSNVFGSTSYVGPQVTVGNGCVIRPGAKVTGNRHISDGSVVG